MASNRLEILVAGDAKQFTDGTLPELNRAVNDTVGNIVTQSQKAAIGLGAITAAGGALISGFVSKASEMQGFEATLTALTGSADTARQKLQEMADFAATTPFDLPGVVKAGTVLTGLGLSASEQLPRVGNLAAVMNRDLPEAALIFAKAMNGSRDGLQSLFDSGVVTKDGLHDLGANMDKTGAIAVEGAANVEALQGALKKMVDTKFGGVMEAQSKTLGGALSNLSDSIGQVQASLGKELAPTIEEAARGLTGVLDAVKNMDPFMKSLVANGLLAGTAFAAIGAGLATFNLAILPAYGFLTNYVAATHASVAANAEAAIAAHAQSVAVVIQTEAEVLAAEALVQEALAAKANATTKEEGILAAEGLAIAETELAAATEAAAAANATYTGTSVGALTGIQALGASVSTLTAKFAAMAMSVGGIAIAIGLLVGGGLLIATAAWNSYTEATEKQIASSKKQLAAFHEQKTVVLESAAAVRKWGDDTDQAVDQVSAALKRMGKDDLDVTRAMAGNGELLRNLREQQRKLNMTSGNDEQKEAVAKEIAELEKRDQVLRKARHELRGTHQAEVDAAEKKQVAIKKEQDGVEKLIEAYKRKSSAGVYATDKEQLAELDKVLAVIPRTHKEYQNLNDTRVKLARQAAAEEKKAADDVAKHHEENRKKELAAQMHQLDLVVGGDQAAIKQRIDLLTQFLASSKINTDERYRLEIDLARETMALEKAKVEAVKKAEADKKKAAADASKARLAVSESEKKASEAEISVLQEKFRQGEAVLPQLEAEIAKRNQLTAAIEREKAAHEGVGKSASIKTNLRKAAEAEIAAEAKKSDMEIQKVRETAQKREADNAAKNQQILVEKGKQAEENLREQLAAGGKVGEQLKHQVEERQKAERQELVDKARAQSIGASAQDQERIRKDLELDMLTLTGKQTAEARALTAELEKQKALTEEKKSDFTLGGTSGVEGAGNFDAWNITKRDPKTGKPLKDVLADQSKAQADAQNALGDGKDANEKGPTRSQAIVEQLKRINQTLDRIDKTPVKVAINTSGAPATENKDWRTSTNKTGTA